MDTIDVGKKLVALCQQGKNDDAVESLYAPDIVSVEAISMPEMPAEVRGKQAVIAKGKKWEENNVIHKAEVQGPYPKGDSFAVRFVYDVTHKPTGKRSTMDEIALYTVQNDKIVREEFFYSP